MRTIKFRGKRLDNGEWVYGDLLHIAGGCLIYFGSDTETRSPDIQSDSKVAVELHKDEIAVVGPATVGQFTGAIDRNGKKIYEGDIVLAKSAGEYRKCQVVYAEHSCNFILYTKIGPWFMHGEIDSMLEVIGNIHDNPELLNEK